MELKTGYKQTEVGVIPNDWDVKKLQSLSEKNMVGIASSATHAYRENGIVMFRNQNIKPNHLDDKDILYIAPEYEAVFKNKRLKAGDLLTARTGYPGTTCIVPPYYEGAQSFTTLISRVKDNLVCNKYLSFYLNSEKGQLFFEQNQIGGGQKNVNAGTLKLMPIPLPPTIAEQTAIATALSDTDQYITHLEKLITKKRNIKQGAMQELLKPKEGWVVKKLGDYVKITSGESPSRFKFGSNGIPYFKVEQLNSSEKYQIETPFYIEINNVIPKGSIIFPKRGASILLNKVRILSVDSYMDTNLMTLTLSEELHSEFIYYLLISIGLWRIADTTSIPQINNKHINPIEISCPSIEEQERIATILSDMDSEITTLETQLSKAQSIKQGMMQHLLTGKIRLI